MPSSSTFKPAWWLPGPHLQTLFPFIARRFGHRPPLRRERLELADGDFIDLDWTVTPADGPIVLILHGLEGSSRSGYARGLLQAVSDRGWRGVVMHFRGCSGEPNRLPRSYCAGETDDIATVVGLLRRREPKVPIVAVGYSLGGNALLKWLGESGADNPLTAAVAVSVPLLLARSAWRMNRGLSRLYQGYLLRSLKASYRRKMSMAGQLPVPAAELDRLNSFYTFDDRITAPLHGYRDADDYYSRASARQYLIAIMTPTLVLHAADDPFMTKDVVPAPCELSPAVQFECSHRGGHVGFVTGALPWRPQYWLEQRIGRFITDRFEH